MVGTAAVVLSEVVVVLDGNDAAVGTCRTWSSPLR
jgi:hypothetical protein